MLLKNKFIGALTYPAILMTVSLGAIVALFVYVLPAIFEIASEMDASKIPRLTLQLKAFSDFLINHSFSLDEVLRFLHSQDSSSLLHRQDRSSFIRRSTKFL